jgi:hypothetical protein
MPVTALGFLTLEQLLNLDDRITHDDIIVMAREAQARARALERPSTDPG